jgi:hypothetical protein
VFDFEAVGPDGKAHLMGDIFTATAPLKLRAKVLGTDAILQVDVIRNNEFLYTQKPGTKDVEFEYVDQAPKTGTNWYYLWVTQLDRNLAWSSPVWVTYGR